MPLFNSLRWRVQLWVLMALGLAASWPTARGDDVQGPLRLLEIARPSGRLASTRVSYIQIPESRRKRHESKVNQMLDRLEAVDRSELFTDSWASQLKEIVDIGPAAVPDLIAELDVTESNIMLRNLGFMLRAIGDKRAVPALIRAVPRTLAKQRSSDMGCRAGDKELLAFMQKHDLDAKDREGLYSFGRPMREITGALVKLTGATQGEDELRWVFLGGSVQQQLAQRRVFYRYAQRWTAWWEANWQKHVTDEAYADVDLPPGDDEPSVAFPHGDAYRLIGVAAGATLESDSAAMAREVFYDLDTGRHAPMPERFRELPDDAQRLDAIQDWAATEGFDLMGTEYLPRGEKQRRFVIRSLGMTAWETSDFRWETFEKEIASREPVKLGRPASGVLLHFDDKTQRFEPVESASFLFATREGAYGLIRIGVEVLDTNVKLDGPPLSAADNPVLNSVGFYKGRRFSYWVVGDAEPKQTE